MRVLVRDSTALAAGSAVSGLLAYVFFALVTRSLGAEGAAPVSVLWTYWSFAGATLTFPVQHWIVRTVTAHRGEGVVRAVIWYVGLVVLALAVVCGGLAWLLRDRLFHRDDALFPLMVAGVTIGSAFVGIVRGVLTARHEYVSVALALVAENALRCAAALALMWASVKSSALYGLALLVGQSIGFLWPRSLRLAGGGSDPHEGVSWIGFLGGAAGGQLLAQTVLTGGPVVLALSGGSPAEVTSLFAVLALFRAPFTLGLGMVSGVTGRLTSLVVRRELDSLRRTRRWVVGLTVAGVVLAVLVGGLLGPWLVRSIFGGAVQVSREISVLTAVGSAVALGNLFLTVMVMAQNRSHAVVRAWCTAALVGAVVLLVLGTEPLATTAWAFLAAEVAAFAALLVAQTVGARRLGLTEPVRT